MFICGLLFYNSAIAQNMPTENILELDRVQYEELFLKQNLLLLAEKHKIDQAEALLLQAKLWPNPNLTLDEVNLWANTKQLSY